MDYTLKAREVFMEMPDSTIKMFSNTQVYIENDRIAEADSGGVVIDLGRYRLLPGLIDIHVHGGNGVDVMDLSSDAVIKIAEFKLLEGVTAFCPTTVTSPMNKTIAAVNSVKAAMADSALMPEVNNAEHCSAEFEKFPRARNKHAKILGTFLEGPYIDPAFKGAHPENCIRPVSIAELKELIRAGDGSIKSVAIAPNLPGALEAIEFLTGQGINVRIGHSAATLKEAEAAIAKGAGLMIHAYNAMSPFNHREPGMAGAALSNSDVYVEVICDLIHVHPAALRILYNARLGEKIVLITDCLMAGGLPDGEYMLGELPIIVKDSEARLANGVLAGSTLGLMCAVKNMHKVVGVPFEKALAMASLNPAAALGLSQLGGIRPGKKADLIAIDDDYNVVFVMVDGEILLDERS